MEEKNDGQTKPPTTAFHVEDVEDEEEAPMETTESDKNEGETENANPSSSTGRNRWLDFICPKRKPWLSLSSDKRDDEILDFICIICNEKLPTHLDLKDHYLKEHVRKSDAESQIDPEEQLFPSGNKKTSNSATALPNSPLNPLLRCTNCKKVWNNGFQALDHNCNPPDLLCYEEGLPSSSELEQERSDENDWSNFLSELSALCEPIPQSAEEPELPTDGELVQSVEESSPMETEEDDSNKKRNDEPEAQKTESTRPEQLEEIQPCSSESRSTQDETGTHVHLERMQEEQDQISEGFDLMKITSSNQPEHTPVGSYIHSCYICNGIFKSLSELTDHILAHEVDLAEQMKIPYYHGQCTCKNHETTRYYPNYGPVCDGCEEVFNNTMQQRDHKCPNLCPSHSSCDDCGQDFNNPEQIKNHICPKLNMAFGKNEESTSKKQNDGSTLSGKNGRNGKTIPPKKNGKSNPGANAKNAVQQNPQKNGKKPPKPEPLVCKFCNLQFQSIPHLIAHEKKEHKDELERLRNTPKADRSTENQEGLAMATDQRSADQGLDSSTDTEETIPIPRPPPLPPSDPRTSDGQKATGITITPIPPTKSEKKGKRHPCRKCRRPFPTLATRTEHERNCFVKPADPVQKPTVAEAPTKKEFHKCEECVFVGHSVQQLLEHVEANHQDWMKCKFCNKEFKEERNYDRHKCHGHQPQPVKPKPPANEFEDDDDNNNNDDPPTKPEHRANRKKIMLPPFSNEWPWKMCDRPGCGFKYYNENTLWLHLDQAHPHKKDEKSPGCDKKDEKDAEGRKKEWLCHSCGGIFEEKDRDSHVCMGLQPDKENNNDFHASYGHHPAPANLAKNKDPAHSDSAAVERKNNERPKKAKKGQKKKDKNQKKEWLCDVCGEKFRYEILLKGHIRDGHPKLSCSKCPKIFYSRERYFCHLNTHAYFKCKVCKARFFKLRSLIMHIWTSNHNGHNPSSWHYYLRCFKCRKWIPKNNKSLKAHASTCFLKQKKR